MKLDPNPSWLRAGVRAKAIGVDRENNMLRGYVVAQVGPFKSEGRGEFDRQSLEALVKLGNAKEGGLKSRFTHPDMSNDGLGKFLGRAKGLYMDRALDARTGKMVDAVRADLKFDPTALDTPPNGGKPLGIYVMELAESDPDALSSSIVLHADQEYRVNKDGTLQLDEDGEPLPPLWRPTQLHASDIVDTGDAVDGLLSANLSVDGFPMAALWQGAQLLDSVFEGQSREAIEARLNAYVQRYLGRKFGEPEVIETPRVDSRAKAFAKMKAEVMRG